MPIHAERGFYATGRRKEATARVWLKAGTGAVVINGRDINNYFGRETSKMVLAQPLGPMRKLALQLFQHMQPGIELHPMTLAVVKGNGLHPIVDRECLGQAGGGILPTRKKNQGGFVHAQC